AGRVRDGAQARGRSAVLARLEGRAGGAARACLGDSLTGHSRRRFGRCGSGTCTLAPGIDFAVDSPGRRHELWIGGVRDRDEADGVILAVERASGEGLVDVLEPVTADERR